MRETQSLWVLRVEGAYIADVPNHDWGPSVHLIGTIRGAKTWPSRKAAERWACGAEDFSCGGWPGAVPVNVKVVTTTTYKIIPSP